MGVSRRAGARRCSRRTKVGGGEPVRTNFWCGKPGMVCFGPPHRGFDPPCNCCSGCFPPGCCHRCVWKDWPTFVLLSGTCNRVKVPKRQEASRFQTCPLPPRRVRVGIFHLSHVLFAPATNRGVQHTAVAAGYSKLDKPRKGTKFPCEQLQW